MIEEEEKSNKYNIVSIIFIDQIGPKKFVSHFHFCCYNISYNLSLFHVSMEIDQTYEVLGYQLLFKKEYSISIEIT